MMNTGYNLIAIPLAAGVAYKLGILLDPAAGAALMALSTIIVAINAKFLRLEKKQAALLCTLVIESKIY